MPPTATTLEYASEAPKPLVYSRLAKHHLLDNQKPDYLRLILTAKVYEILKETPLVLATNLSAKLGNEIWLKREDLQEVFSFKIRGAYNFMASLNDEERWKGVITCSAGNHAQGVALSGSKLSIPCTIVMPRGTPSIKVRNVERLGAKVILHGIDFDEAKAECARLADVHRLVFVPPYDDPLVIAGQGTIGMEILKQLPDSDNLEGIFAAVGGGGLVAGISADGTAVRIVGSEGFRICKELLDGVVKTDNDAICAAIKDIFEETRSITEPAGALAVAGLKHYILKNNLVGAQKRFVAVISGANMNFDRLRFVAERAELGEGREALFSVDIPEKPGSFLTLHTVIHPRDVTEFIYRYNKSTAPDRAHVLVSFKVDAKKRTAEIKSLLNEFEVGGMKGYDISDNELAKSHGRYLIGGSQPVPNERIFRFEFPERPNALRNFLLGLRYDWNISLFHYRNHGADIGKVLAGIQVPPLENDEFDAFLKKLNYTGSNGRHKRPKQEDTDDLTEDRKNGTAHSVSTSSNSSTQGSTKSKRKPKEKLPPPEETSDTTKPPLLPPEMAASEGQEEEEEGGITRCVCGNTGEDDPDAGEFMVQCETCKVWQHGLCMGFESEDQLHDGDYYCEQCRPDMHVDLLKSPHPPTKSQPSKRRNTMNSAFDENLKQILETTAIEAGADPATIHVNDQPTALESEELPETNNRNKKRKRTENEMTTTKKRRSMSTTSDHPPTVNGNEETPVFLPPPPPPPPASKSGGRNKRGGRKSAVVHDVPVDNGDGKVLKETHVHPNPSRIQEQVMLLVPTTLDEHKATTATQTPKPPLTLVHIAILMHYLSHLEEMLPTDVPKPIEVVAGATGRESIERTTERGVKVKWPSKRTSVADMNKRVRALVEWVGREQASASDRARRHEALEIALKKNAANAFRGNGASGAGSFDRSVLTVSSLDRNAEGGSNRPGIPGTSSMKDMEALMEELIGFQEKFGPGARRERRIAS
ncbi:hypothetical protein HHX47_DHR3001093 [Lentinula edodes]|nr:hypothetical protein HHX47_DHR3001093 [Lentinula edodes]